MKSIFLVIIFMFCANIINAQFSLSGYVLDNNKSPLPGASVLIESSGKGVATDNKGYFEIANLQKGKYKINVSYIGFKNEKFTVVLNKNKTVNVLLLPDNFVSDEIIVLATRATFKTPVTYNNITQKDIKGQNLGQDLPIMLSQLPSVVTTSDAGAGVGYTGIRIRGSDASRINVTINGIPYNDSESQGTYWVDLPDIASSIEDIQVQRGVGTSTNGSGAFGASLNIRTNKPEEKGYVKTSNTIGSYNTRKHNLDVSTGIYNNFYGRVRLSKIKSDGYIDRSGADLTSFFTEAGYISDKTQVKAMVFGGHEITHQAWYGTPEAVINKDVEGIDTFISHEGYGFTDEQIKNLRDNKGRTYNHYTYDNEIDDYEQTHYQLHLTHKFNDNYTFNVSGNYTRGLGYFEQYKAKKKVKKFFPDSSNGKEKGDVIVRRWLDNHFLAMVYSLNYKKDNLNITLGGGYNSYDGEHYGKVIWNSWATEQVDYRKQYYFSTGLKKEFNTYLKVGYDITNKLFAYGDLQYRAISHTAEGNNNDLLKINLDKNFSFFNPKVGLSYAITTNSNMYASFAIANREPDRDALTKNKVMPTSENLQDIEFGYKFRNTNLSFLANIYYMNYKDQLVLTGEIDDVGDPAKINVDKSYRAGIELQAGYKINQHFHIDVNATFSKNKIKEFDYIVYDTQYNPNTWEDVSYEPIVKKYKDTDISFSPNIIANGKFTYKANDYISVAWISKYVGKQFLDNTSSDNKSIDSYFVNNLHASLKIKQKFMQEISFNFVVNNIFSEEYSSNGYTYSYFYRPVGSNNPAITEKFYYPQATRNFLMGVTLKF